MCGINGMLFLNGVARSAEMMKAIRYVFDEVLVETQERGHHATGLAVFRREPSETAPLYDFYKAPVSAKILTTYDSNYDAIIDNISDATGSIISHTRWYTKGKPENNLNNHPFDVGNVVGVHNGTISNDDELFRKNAENFTRVGEVDSEIIYQLINFHNQDGITYEGLKEALEKSLLKGMFALAFAHKNQPNLVHIVKQERPMDFVMWEEAGVVLFNSQKSFIHDAFDKLNRISKRFGMEVPVTLKEYELTADKYITLDANATTFEEVFSEPQSLFLLSSATKTNHNWSGKNTGTSTTGAVGNGGASSNMTHISAADSIGRVIEGELDTVSGEVIIFTASQLNNVGDNDDGSEAGEDDNIWCIECGSELQEHEVHASYNEGASDTGTHYCKVCHEKALTGVFAG